MLPMSISWKQTWGSVRWYGPGSSRACPVSNGGAHRGDFGEGEAGPFQRRRSCTASWSPATSRTKKPNAFPNTAFVPAANEHLQSLRALNTTLVAQLQQRRPRKIATLDCDATLVPTDSRSALCCYKHFCAYQPRSSQRAVLSSFRALLQCW